MKTGVVVTGVSTGIGAAAMRALVQAGYTVFGTVRRGRDTDAVQAAGATPVLMDVTVKTSIERARETVIRALDGDPLAGLVNNAGIPGVGPIELVDLEEVRRTFDVNVIGVVAVTQAFLPLLRASRGRIINISSVSGRVALPYAGPYAGSKFAVEALSDSLRRELLGTGVEVIVLQPGSVRSAIWSKIAAINLAPLRGTIYERGIEKLRELALRSGEKGMGPERVAEAVIRALRAPHPPTRFLVLPRGKKLRQRLSAFLPDRLIDRIIWRRMFGKGKREE